MKILFINTGPWGTGSFTCIKGLTQELINLGHEVKIFFPDANLQSIDKNEYYNHPELYHIWEFPIKDNDTQISTFPLMITDPHPRNPDPITFKNLSENQINLYEKELYKNLLQLINSYKPDIIECHHIWYASWILFNMGLNYLTVAHHSDQLGLRYDNRIHDKAIASAKGSQKIIAVSEFVKKEVIRLYHVDEDMVTVINNGYDKTIFRKKNVDRAAILHKLKINIDPKATIISFAGKLSRTKGIDTLLQANKYLEPKLNIHFIVMGSGAIEPIRNRMEPNSYSFNNMHFVGQQSPENVADIHNISKLSVMPSRSEGFGIAGLEAMACHLPLIATRCEGLENFAVGRFIDIGSSEQLANAILEILNLSELEYQQLCQQAFQTAIAFSWSKSVKQHLDIYKDLLSEKTEKHDRAKTDN